MQEKSPEKKPSILAFLAKSDATRLSQILSPLHALCKQHHDTVTRINGKSTEVLFRHVTENGTEQTMAEKAAQEFDFYKLEWERLCIHRDFIEAMIEKQTEVKNFLSGIKDVGSDPARETLAKLFPKKAEQEVEDMDALYAALMQFIDLDLKDADRTVRLDKLATDLSDIMYARNAMLPSDDTSRQDLMNSQTGHQDLINSETQQLVWRTKLMSMINVFAKPVSTLNGLGHQIEKFQANQLEK